MWSCPAGRKTPSPGSRVTGLSSRATSAPGSSGVGGVEPVEQGVVGPHRRPLGQQPLHGRSVPVPRDDAGEALGADREEFGDRLVGRSEPAQRLEAGQGDDDLGFGVGVPVGAVGRVARDAGGRLAGEAGSSLFVSGVDL